MLYTYVMPYTYVLSYVCVMDIHVRGAVNSRIAPLHVSDALHVEINTTTLPYRSRLMHVPFSHVTLCIHGHVNRVIHVRDNMHRRAIRVRDTMHGRVTSCTWHHAWTSFLPATWCLTRTCHSRAWRHRRTWGHSRWWFLASRRDIYRIGNVLNDAIRCDHGIFQENADERCYSLQVYVLWSLQVRRYVGGWKDVLMVKIEWPSASFICIRRKWNIRFRIYIHPYIQYWITWSKTTLYWILFYKIQFTDTWTFKKQLKTHLFTLAYTICRL